MKPILILPEGAMKPEHIQALNDNGICTVEAKDPAAVKFVDPIPATSSRTEVENAAIQLSRRVLNWQKFNISGLLNEADWSRIFVKLLAKGTSLDADPSRLEQEQQLFDAAKRDELQRLAREEARAERAAAREAKKAAEQTRDKKKT